MLQALELPHALAKVRNVIQITEIEHEVLQALQLSYALGKVRDDLELRASVEAEVEVLQALVERFDTEPFSDFSAK